MLLSKWGKQYSIFVVSICIALTCIFSIPANAAIGTPIFGWGDGNTHWYENGKIVKDHAFFDPASNAWYWADADGSIATDKDVFIPKDESDRSKGGKWVRFDKDRHMVKGEDFRYGGWYLFDGVTGEMAKGVAHVDSNGGKWVYYDTVTGQMAHGERYLDYDAAHTGWYLFDGVTGAMAHGDVFVSSNGGKWVRYDRVSGQMVKGLQWQDGSWYYFDRTTGAMAHGNAWVPEWNRTAHFDEITGRYTGDAPSANEPQATTGVIWWSTSRYSTDVYHDHRDCPSLQNADPSNIRSGTLDDARRAGKTRLCKNCEHMS